MTWRTQVMSFSGSPSSAMIAASSPGARVPIWSDIFIASAATEFAETSASIGAMPPSSTRLIRSSTLWPCIPASASVPKTILRPETFRARWTVSCAIEQQFLHRLELLRRLGKEGCTRITLTIVQIILDELPGLWVEVDTFLCHCMQIAVGRAQTVLDLRATGGDGTVHRLVIRMDKRSQPQPACFVTGCVQHWLRNRLRGLAHATRGINLQEVGSSLFLFTDESPDFVRRSRLLAAAHERFYDRQDPWRRQPALSRCLAKPANTVHALYGGEPSEKSRIGICDRAVRGFGCGYTHSCVLTVRSEARCDMHMRIDPTGHHSQTAQIIVDGEVVGSMATIFEPETTIRVSSRTFPLPSRAALTAMTTRFCASANWVKPIVNNKRIVGIRIPPPQEIMTVLHCHSPRHTLVIFQHSTQRPPTLRAQNAPPLGSAPLPTALPLSGEADGPCG